MSNTVQQWFGLSYASFAVLPRVLMQDMPDDWQARMAVLLRELDNAFPSQPYFDYHIQMRQAGRLPALPDCIVNYRYPMYGTINGFREPN